MLPAGVSLAAAGVDALGQSVVQRGVDHIEADGLLMHLAAGIPAEHTQNLSSTHTQCKKNYKQSQIEKYGQKVLEFDKHRRGSAQRCDSEGR